MFVLRCFEKHKSAFTCVPSAEPLAGWYHPRLVIWGFPQRTFCPKRPPCMSSRDSNTELLNARVMGSKHCLGKLHNGVIRLLTVLNETLDGASI
jgi:hypothetical protein